MNSIHTPWPRGLKLFWLLVGVPVCLLWGLSYAVRLTPPYQRWSDFLQEWSSVRNWATGHPIYMDMRQSVPLHCALPYDEIVHVNAHPPAANLVALPFVDLPYEQAFLSWTLFSLVLLVVAAGLLFSRRDLGYSRWIALPVTFLLLTSGPLAQQVFLGQLNLLLLLLIVLAWLGLRSGRQVWGGAALGIAAAIKLFPAFLFLYLIAQRRWRGLIAGAATFVGLNLVTALVFGWQTYSSYVLDVMPRVARFQDHWLNASLAGFFHKLFVAANGHVIPLWQNPRLAQACIVVTCLAVTAVTGWLLWRAKGRCQCDEAFALCVIAMLLVSPIAWDHYFLLLVLPLAILWKAPSVGWASRALILLVIVVLGTIRPSWIWGATIAGDGELASGPGAVPSVATTLQALTVISFQFYALLLLFAFVCWRVATATRAVTAGAVPEEAALEEAALEEAADPRPSADSARAGMQFT